MSLIIKGMRLPKHADVNGEKDTAYKCLILAHSDNSVELVIDTAFASPYDNGHNIQRYPLSEIPTPHGRLIDADKLTKNMRNYYPSIDHLCCSQHVVTKRDIDNAPTVIEAEVSE